MKSIKIMLIAGIVIGCASSQVTLSKCSGGSCAIKSVRKTTTIKATTAGKAQTTPTKNTKRTITCKSGSCSRK